MNQTRLLILSLGLALMACGRKVPSLSQTSVIASEDTYYEGLELLPEASFRLALHQRISQSLKLNYNQIFGFIEQADADPDNPSRLLMFYSGRSLARSTLSNYEDETEADGWNREHVWAKSRGFPRGNMRAFSDLHNLRACETRLNRLRGNFEFGESPSSEEVPVSMGNRMDRVAELWLPRPAARGDVARILFYMDLRYEGDRTLESDLKLVEKLPPGLRNGMNAEGQGYFSRLSTLLRWHEEDPVDEQERRRNNTVQRIQGNRNPFVDHPEWALRLYR